MRTFQIALTQGEKTELEAVLEKPYFDQQPYETLRARAILLAAEGKTNNEIARELQVSLHSVHAWRRHWLAYPMLTPQERCVPLNTALRNKTRGTLAVENDPDVLYSYNINTGEFKNHKPQ